MSRYPRSYTGTVDFEASDDITIQDDLVLDSDGALIQFGESQDVTLTHSADTLTLASGDTLAITTADKLTVGGVIVPQYFEANIVIPAGAATADYDGLFHIARAACQVVAVYQRHQTAGNDAGAVTLMVKKVPSGTAKASGTDVLSAGINLKATADTIQTGTLHGTTGNLQLAATDGLGLVVTGTPTAVDGVSVSVWLKRI